MTLRRGVAAQRCGSSHPVSAAQADLQNTRELPGALPGGSPTPGAARTPAAIQTRKRSGANPLTLGTAFGPVSTADLLPTATW
jgi:hypothetical protein